MVNDKLLLNDGSSNVLLNDGTSVVLLNSEAAVGGVVISGTHATPMMYRKRLQLIPVEFTFWLKAEIITTVETKAGFRAVLVKKVETQKTSITSTTLLEQKHSSKWKSTTVREKHYRCKIGSTTLKEAITGFAIRANTILEKTVKLRDEKIKKIWLEKLKDYLNEED